jgi:DNA-3-methyladenine glycosylase II
VEQQRPRVLDDLSPGSRGTGAPVGHPSRVTTGAAPAATAAEVLLPGPLDLDASLEPLRRCGDDLLDRWDGQVLLRTQPAGDGRYVAYAARPVGTLEAPRLRVTVARPEELETGVAAVRSLVIAAPEALAALRRRDPLIDRLELLHPGVRQVLYPDLLSSLVRAISAQQVNLRWAATTRRRLAELVGTVHSVDGMEVRSIDAHRLAATPVADLRELQFTTRKSEYLVAAAEAVASGALDTATLAALPDEEVIARLVAVRGLGRWTAEWVLSRTFGRPVVVAGDLAVRKVVGAAYGGGPIAGETEVRPLTAHWGAAAAVAQSLLLHALGTGIDLTTLATASRRPATS